MLRFSLVILALFGTPVIAGDLSDYWKQPGWDCKVHSKEILLTNKAGEKAAKMLSCVYSATCESDKEIANVSHACRTTLENACPSEDDCIALSNEAEKNSDSTILVAAGRHAEKDNTITNTSTEHAAAVEAQYGKSCKYVPEKFVAVVFRKADPKQPKYDVLCVNRISCDKSSQRDVVSQVACPAVGTVEEKGVKYNSCPLVNDCLATSVTVQKPTRVLLTKDLPKRTGNATVQVTTHVGAPSQASFGK